MNEAPVPFSFQPWFLHPVELHAKPLVPPPPDDGLIDNAIIGHIQEESVRYGCIGSHAQLGAAFVLIPHRARYFRTPRQDDCLLQHIRAAEKAALRLGFFFHCLVPPSRPRAECAANLPCMAQSAKTDQSPKPTSVKRIFLKPLHVVTVNRGCRRRSRHGR